MKIGIVTGGLGPEREVSLNSASNIKEILGIRDEYVFDWPKDKLRLTESTEGVDVFVPMIHGEGGEDGEVQSFLDSRLASYIFSSPDVHRTALDKQKTKLIIKSQGIRVPRSFTDYPDRSVVLKPINGGSSLFVKKINSKKRLEEELVLIKERNFMIEEFIEGREFTVGVVELPTSVTASLPVTELVTSEDIVNYDNKYDPSNMAQELCPADIDKNLENRLKDLALKAHNTIGCSHVSRSDFMVDKTGEVYFLEINTIPGFTKTSLLPDQIKEAKLDAKDIFTYWLQRSDIV